MRGSCTSASARSSRRFMPPGVAAHLAVGGLREADAGQQLAGAALALRAADAVQRGLEPHVLGAGEEGVERRLLEGGADRGAHRGALAHYVMPAHPRRARGGRQQRGEHVDRRGLARAVGSEEAVDLAGLHPQVDPVDRARPLLELPDEVRCFDRGFAHDQSSYSTVLPPPPGGGEPAAEI